MTHTAKRLLYGFFAILCCSISPLAAQSDIQPAFQIINTQSDWRTLDSSLDDYPILSAQEIILAPIQDQEELLLNISDDYALTSTKSRIEQHPNGSQIWVGKLDQQSFGYVLFAQQEGVYWGKIQTDEGVVFLIKPIANSSNYQLLEIDAFQEEENCHLEKPESPLTAPEENSNSADKVMGVCDAGAICSALTIDLLIVYTADARSKLGGSDAAAQAAIAMAIAELNTVGANSNVTHSYSLAHAGLVSYTESGSFGTDLDRLEDAADGQLDEAIDLRDEYYADLVGLICDNGGCGLGNVNTDPNLYRSTTAFSVTSDLCMTSNLSLSHELGHNMGFRHDRYAYGSNPSNVCDYAWGWVNQEAFNGGGGSSRWRTVMAYNAQCSDNGFSCSRIPHWSNPDVNYNGDPTGSAIGNTDEANNAYLLDRSACLVDDFRVPVNCSGSCTLYQASENYNPNTASGPGNTTDINITESFTPIAGGSGNVEVCIYYLGDHSSGAETFDVKDENGNVLGQTVASNDCEARNRVCFSSTPADFNNWIADGTITISLDPTGTGINPTLCSRENRASAEILATQGPLPVELVSFEARAEGKDIQVDWSTALEINNDYFQLEYSRDGFNFQALSQIASKGDANYLQNYEYQVFNPGKGTHYLRLLQVDIDGTESLSEIRAVVLEEEETPQLSIAPNPTEGIFFLNAESLINWEDTQVELFDFAGRQIQVPSTGLNEQLQVNLANQPNGLYYLRVRTRSSGEILATLPVMKQ